MYTIDKLQINGSGLRHHIVVDLAGPKISLAYVNESVRVYWGDSGTGKLASISVHGGNRKFFRKVPIGPASLAVFSGVVFWNEEHLNELLWADKSNESPYIKNITLPLSSNCVPVTLNVIGGGLNSYKQMTEDEKIKQQCLR